MVYVSGQRLSCRVLGAFAKLRQATISFVTLVCLSVRPSVQNNWTPTGRNCMKLMFECFSENLLSKLKVY
jgi:hypothetical protein